MNRYFIHDFGLINAMGDSKEAIFDNWKNGTSPGLCLDKNFNPNYPSYIARVTARLPAIPDALKAFACRNNQLLLATLMQINSSVQSAIDTFGKNRIGVVLGTSTSGIANGELALEYFHLHGQAPDDYHFLQQDIGTGCEFLKRYLDIHGPSTVISTACSSSGNAFNTARRLIELNLCDAVIVGGADSLCKMTVQGFASLESVSPDICQPFSVNRNGITIGEAAALFIISKQPANIELYGVGASADAHHISAPDPSGNGACQSMERAFKQSPFSPQQLNYLNLHGTATPLNDAMESRAVYKTFGSEVVCSSTKSLTGHTLGAAAATELGLCCLLLSSLNHEHIIPAQVWDGCFDPELPELHLSTGERSPHPVKLCLSNSFAFGGNNVSLLVGHAYETF